MLINIDIKIADNDGNLVHHLNKHFNDEDSACLEKLNTNYLGESFENFLSEYMSFSSYAVRERLISCSNSATSNPIPSDSFEEINASESRAINHIEKSAIEYKIRIGNKNVFVGSIPYAQKTISEVNSDLPSINNNISISTAYFDQELESLDHMIDTAMLKAIKKYEANLCPVSLEDEYARLEAELSNINL